MKARTKLVLRLFLYSILTGYLIHVVGSAKIVKKDPEIESYIDEFRQYAIGIGNVKFDTLSYEITEISDMRAAECNPFMNHIRINKIYWKQIPKLNRKLLIWHELGHCVAWKGHNDHEFKDGCQVSLMATYTQNSHCNWKYENHYKRELRSW